MNFKAQIKNSEKGVFFFLKRSYYAIARFSVPAPKVVWRPVWFMFKFVRNIFYWCYRVFWVTPLFVGSCHRVGKRFRAGTFLPFVIGKGHIIIGDNVTFHGKADFVFGSIKKEVPEIYIGNNTGIGHGARFDISDTLKIGDDCLIAANVSFHDASGHHVDPELRKAKVKIDEKQIRSITIGDNVWIGDGAYINPGAQIGDDCVIAARTVVMGRRIPPNSLIYASPNKVIKIRKISRVI